MPPAVDSKNITEMSPSIANDNDHGPTIEVSLQRIEGLVHCSWLTESSLDAFKKDCTLTSEFMQLARKVVNNWIESSKSVEVSKAKPDQVDGLETYRVSVQNLEKTIQIISAMINKVENNINFKSDFEGIDELERFFQVIVDTLPSLDIATLESGVTNFKLMGVAWKAVLRVEQILAKLSKTRAIETCINHSTIRKSLCMRIEKGSDALRSARGPAVFKASKVLSFFMNQVMEISTLVCQSSKSEDTNAWMNIFIKHLPGIYEILCHVTIDYSEDDCKVITATLTGPVSSLVESYCKLIDNHGHQQLQVLSQLNVEESSVNPVGHLKMMIATLMHYNSTGKLALSDAKFQAVSMILKQLKTIPRKTWLKQASTTLLHQVESTIMKLCDEQSVKDENVMRAYVKSLTWGIFCENQVVAELTASVVPKLPLSSHISNLVINFLDAICNLADCLVTMLVTDYDANVFAQSYTQLRLMACRLSRLTRDYDHATKSTIVLGILQWRNETTDKCVVTQLLMNESPKKLNQLEWTVNSTRSTLILAELLPSWWRYGAGEAITKGVKVSHFDFLSALMRKLSELSQTTPPKIRRTVFVTLIAVAQFSEILLNCFAQALQHPTPGQSPFAMFSTTTGKVLRILLSDMFPSDNVDNNLAHWHSTSKEGPHLMMIGIRHLLHALAKAAIVSHHRNAVEQLVETMKLMDQVLASTKPLTLRASLVQITCEILTSIAAARKVSEVPNALVVVTCTMNSALEVAAYSRKACSVPLLQHVYCSLEYFVLHSPFPAQEVSNLLLQAHRKDFMKFLSRSSCSPQREGVSTEQEDSVSWADQVETYSLKIQSVNDQLLALEKVKWPTSGFPTQPSRKRIRADEVKSLVSELYKKVPQVDVLNLPSDEFLLKYERELDLFSKKYLQTAATPFPQ